MGSDTIHTGYNSESQAHRKFGNYGPGTPYSSTTLAWASRVFA